MEINRLCMGCMKEIEDNGQQCPHCGYHYASASENEHCLKPYTILNGKYLVGKVLGEGGFGITYIGYDLSLEIPVAIKEFYPNGFVSRENSVTNIVSMYKETDMDMIRKWKDNFLKEAKTLARCSQLSGIVGVKDFFEENATVYIVMEYLDGMTLKEYAAKAGGKLEEDSLLLSLKPIMQAMSEVHKKGLVHRDISPDNIMLLDGGGMKLLDFGSAREYSEGAGKSCSVMLKPGYAPEELYRTKGKQGPWSDIYSMAATIYKCITGVTPPESMERMRQDELKNPSEFGISISLQTEAALLKGMAVYAEDRFQSMEEFMNALFTQENMLPGQTAVNTELEVKGENTLTESTSHSKNKIKAAAAISIACALAAIVVLSVISVNLRRNILEKQEEVREPLYTIEDVETIDLSQQSHQPGTKRQGMSWDISLFYWLEDVDNTSDEDGNIADCKITKTQIRNAANGNIIEYEAYRDKETGEIYKIVGIEEQGEFLLLTDYYYLNGKVNFIFLRNDSVYTPTYATTSKTGNRFYFNNDVMVRWRKVDKPKQIEETTLYPKDVAYAQEDYFGTSEAVREKYDATELAMLNEAYNVYDVINGQTGIGVLQGRVTDVNGNPMAEQIVSVFRQEDDVLLYQGKTQKDGTFSIYVYLDNTECYMNISGGKEYKTLKVNNVLLADKGITYSYDNLVMHRTGKEEYPVQLSLYNAANGKDTLANAMVSFREGVAAYEGEVLFAVETDENGLVSAELPEGTYTVSAERDDYMTTYLNVIVTGAKNSYKGYLVPKISKGQSAVVLTWDAGDVDLDLTVFTPYQTEGGDMAHIGGSVLFDEYGNRLLTEERTGVEVAYIDTAVLGSYKVYVNNYTDSLAGNYDSDALSTLHAHVCIYSSEGMLEDYTIPSDSNGVVWEVAQISGAQVTANQRVYKELDGKNWWLESKEH